MNEETTKRFCEVYDEHYYYIYKRAYFILYDQALSHDIAQEVFSRAIVQLEQGNTEVLALRYLKRIATNLCIDTLRRKETVPQIPLEEEPVPVGFAFDGQTLADRVVYLREVFQKLPASLQEVAVYRLIDGYRLDEVVELTGLSRRTVQRKLDKIRARLEPLSRR